MTDPHVGFSLVLSHEGHCDVDFVKSKMVFNKDSI